MRALTLSTSRLGDYSGAMSCIHGAWPLSASATVVVVEV